MVLCVKRSLLEIGRDARHGSSILDVVRRCESRLGCYRVSNEVTGSDRYEDEAIEMIVSRRGSRLGYDGTTYLITVERNANHPTVTYAMIGVWWLSAFVVTCQYNPTFSTSTDSQARFLPDNATMLAMTASGIPGAVILPDRVAQMY